MQYTHCEFPLIYTDTVHISVLLWRPIHLPHRRWAPSTYVRCRIYREPFNCQNTNKLSVLQRIALWRAQGRVAVSCSGWQNNAIADCKHVSYHMLGHPTHIGWLSIEWVNAMHVRLARLTACGNVCFAGSSPRAATANSPNTMYIGQWECYAQGPVDSDA